MERSGPPGELLARRGEFQVAQVAGQAFDGGGRDQQGGLLDRAGVRTRRPGQMRAPAGGDGAGCQAVGGGVGCGVGDQDELVGHDPRAVEVDVLAREVRRVVRHRRLVPQDILDGVLRGERAAGQGAVVGVVGQHPRQRVGDQVGGRLVPGAHGEHDLVQDLLRAQAGRVVHEPGRQIDSALLRLEGDQLRDVLLEVRVRPGRFLRADGLHQPGERGDEAVAVGVGHPEQVVEQHQRQRAGVLPDQVDVAVGREGADQGVRGVGDLGTQPVRFDAREAVDDHGPVAGVDRAVVEQWVGAPLHHRQDRTVGRQRLLPLARILRPGRRVLEQVQGCAVVRDEEGRDTGGDRDGGEGPVLAQPGVDGVGVLSEVGPVQRDRLGDVVVHEAAASRAG